MKILSLRNMPVVRHAITVCLGAISLTLSATANAQSPDLEADTTLATPTITDANVYGCNGSWHINWTKISGASSYDVQFRQVMNPNNYPFQPYKSTRSIASIVDVAAGNKLGTEFEVRACNGTSCGALSNPITLNYYKGCP